MNKKIVVGSVIYQQAMVYLDEFFESLEMQSDSDFVILLINDDIPFENLKVKISCTSIKLHSKIIILDRYGKVNNPSELRVELIKEAYKRRFDILVMLDCDDKASLNRIENIRRQFDEKYTFFYNELLDFKKRAVMPTLPNYTNNIEMIRECNYLGISNNALNLKKLSYNFLESLYQGKTLIFDWYFFSRVLLNGGRGKKIIGCCTYYRIYNENIAGRSVYNKQKISNEILVKKQQYKLLSKYDIIYNDLLKIYSSISLDRIRVVNGSESTYWWGLINSQNIGEATE